VSHLATGDWCCEELDVGLDKSRDVIEDEEDTDEPEEDREAAGVLDFGEDRREEKKADKDDVSGSTGGTREDEEEELRDGSKPDSSERIDDPNR